MGLNIKNPRTQQLARELAQLTGETITAAITKALELRIEQIRHASKPGLAERLEAITKETAPLWDESGPSIEDLLYDDLGLPKGLLK